MVAGALGAIAQAPNQAELNEKLLRLQAEVEDTRAANQVLQRNLTTLREDFAKLHEAMQRIAKAYELAGMDYARKGELKSLTDSVQEVEKRRQADQKQFLEKFEELKRFIADMPPKVIQVPASTQNDPGGRSGGPDDPRGVDHTVARGESLTAILAAYNDELKSRGRKARVTLEQVKAANPGLNVNLLQVGQKIFIPIVD